MTKPTMLEIQDMIAEVLDLEIDMELDEAAMKRLDTLLDDLGLLEAEKADAIGQFIRLNRAKAEALKEEGERLLSHAKTCFSKIDWLKNRTGEIMQNYGVKKIKGEIYTLSLRKYKSVHVPLDNKIIEDIENFDPALIRTKVIKEPEKALIRDYLERGIEVPGAKLIETEKLQVS